MPTTVLVIRKPLRISSYVGIVAIAIVALAAVWAARSQPIGLFVLLILLVLVVGGGLIWALLRLAASRIEVDDAEIALRYAFYPTVRVPLRLVDAVETSGAGGLFQPGEGLARGRRHLPVLVMDGGARIPVPMMSRISSVAAERDTETLRQALVNRDGEL